MASPKTDKDRYNATRDWAGVTVLGCVLDRHPDRDTEVLDVGAGWGKYRDLLAGYKNMDAVEIHEPYVDDENLRDRYRHVYVGDVFDLLDEVAGYAVVIMGDVLEHLPYARARTVIDTMMRDSDLYVVVPYLYAQDAVDGVEYERHHQDDLTPENMVTRYPTLRLIALETRDNEPFKGLYTNRRMT